MTAGNRHTDHSGVFSPPLGHLKPNAARSNSDGPAFKRALNLFREAARRVPAYRHFLKKMKIKPDTIRTKTDFERVPLIDKKNYITQYSIEDLSWDGILASAKYISTSSGSTGIPFFWPRGRNQDAVVGMIFRQIYENIFGTRDASTLCVNSFALGTWIAGLEFYNATKWAADCGNPIVMVTPGIDGAEAVNEIKKLASSFRRVVLTGYPPFVKDIIELGKASGIAWKRLDVRLLTGGEAISETWRDYVLALIGKKNDVTSIINVYGMAESGVVAHETPASILFRRVLREISGINNMLPDDKSVMGLYQYYPTVRYFEVVSEGSLALTVDAGLPLIRYNTRDRGGILGFTEFMHRGGDRMIEIARQYRVDLEKWRLPFVYLYGRKDLSVSFYAVNIYVENIKYALEPLFVASRLSGLFVMSVEHMANLDQRLEITVELSRGRMPNAALNKSITKLAASRLMQVNTEYARLSSAIGNRALPKIRTARYGEIHTIPGRKHKWVKSA